MVSLKLVPLPRLPSCRCIRHPCERGGWPGGPREVLPACSQHSGTSPLSAALACQHPVVEGPLPSYPRAQRETEAEADWLTGSGAEGFALGLCSRFHSYPLPFVYKLQRAGEATLAQVALAGQGHGAAAVHAAAQSHSTCTGRHSTPR